MYLYNENNHLYLSYLADYQLYINSKNKIDCDIGNILEEYINNSNGKSVNFNDKSINYNLLCNNNQIHETITFTDSNNNNIIIKEILNKLVNDTMLYYSFINYNIPKQPTAEEWKVIDKILYFKSKNNNYSEKRKRSRRIQKNKKYILFNNSYLIATRNVNNNNNFNKHKTIISKKKDVIQEEDIINID